MTDYYFPRPLPAAEAAAAQWKCACGMLYAEFPGFCPNCDRGTHLRKIEAPRALRATIQPMANHPNRSKKNPTAARHPTPAQVRAAREAAGLTQTEAAMLVHTSLRAWQQWEAEEGTDGHRGMHAAFWELFTIKTMGMTPEDKQ